MGSPALLRAGRVAIALPPGYRAIHADPGAASAARHGDPFTGYLNLTPRQGGETVANFPAFRLAHQRDEARAVVEVSRQPHVTFPASARASCVTDDYTAAHGSHTRYRELACLVAQRTGETWVVLGAAPAASWHSRYEELESAVYGLKPA